MGTEEQGLSKQWKIGRLSQLWGLRHREMVMEGGAGLAKTASAGAAYLKVWMGFQVIGEAERNALWAEVRGQNQRSELQT